MPQQNKSRPQRGDVSLQGRSIVRNDSRPSGTTTNFTMRGDLTTGIGDGKIISWDFSNADDDVTAPTSFKRKRLEIGFSDEVWIKEGALYFKDTPKGQYIDMYVVCKNGFYYNDRNGNPVQAVGDVPTIHYINHYLMLDTALVGIKLNTEGAMEDALPKQQDGYILWIEITTPDTDVLSCGYAELKLYRKRTVLLPGETL